MTGGGVNRTVLRRWLKETQATRIVALGEGSDTAFLERYITGMFAGVDRLPDPWRPTFQFAASPEGVTGDSFDVAVLSVQKLEPGLARTIDRARALARFVVVEFTKGIPEAAWTSLSPLAVHVAGGEAMCLLRGGTEIIDDHTRNSRVWYLVPNRQIFGGVKIIYNHVAILRSMGIDAVLATNDGVNWPATWFNWNPAELCFAPETIVRAGDTVVIPEFRYRDALKFPQAGRRLIFVQNHGLMKGVSEWRALGYDGVLTLGRPDGLPSFLEETLVERGCTLPMFAVPNHFDDDPWHRIPNRKTPGRILCLPRKGPEFVATIVKEFGNQVQCVGNVHQREMAAAYAQADVYVHTGFPEGLGMPIVEAMLAGCVTCGFSGGGGLDVMSDGKTAFVASDGDREGLLRVVRKALASPHRESVREAGRRSAGRFTRSSATEALSRCFLDWLASLTPIRPTIMDRLRSSAVRWQPRFGYW